MGAQMDNNKSDQQSLNEYDDDIDLRELFRVLWAGRIKIIAITAVFALASVYYALSMPNQYKATVLLAPAQSDGGGLSGALGQLGGLASLAGVRLGGGESGEAEIAQEIMKSWSYIEAFIAKNNIAVEVFAAEGWNKESNMLEINDYLYDTTQKSWLIEDEETGELGPPTSWLLFLKFSQMIEVYQNKRSGLVTVSVEYYSPKIAKQWLDMYVESINRFMQQRQVDKVTRNISYLQEQIEKTSIAEMQEVFYTIIEEQTKNKMLAEASPDYVFVTVGPSMEPELKSKPTRSTICILGTLLGGMLSVLLVLAMHYAKKSD